MLDKIIIRGARQHNLKNLSLEIPKNKLNVFTGVSGSGKSSLAFDTIYAEGQRRYVESLSSYARQFLGVMDKPDVDAIDGLSPSISIDQKSTSHNPRSTVGTVTEIYDYLRLLFARIGHPHCPICSREIAKQSPEQIVEQMIDLIKSRQKSHFSSPIRFMILSPIIRDRKGEFTQLFENLRSKGYVRARIDHETFELKDDLVLIKTNKHSIDIVIDRISVQKKDLADITNFKNFHHRISDAVHQALTLSSGLAILSQVKDSTFEFPDKPKKTEDHLFSQKFACVYCNISLPEIEPRIFSFNSPHGACSTCSGIGSLLRVDSDLIINRNLSISEGGILPFAKQILSDTWLGRILITAAQNIGIDITKTLKLVSEEKIKKLLYGTGETVYEVSGKNRHEKIVTIYEKYPGVIPELEKRFSETESEYVRGEIGKYMREEICPSCLGARLKKEALSITIGSLSIVDITTRSIKSSFDWINGLNKNINSREKTIAGLILKEIHNRLQFLISVGLDYLSLDRSARTLAGGEAQRIRLASQIGSGLTGVLYVLDEPSIGLHPRDNKRLIDTLKRLRDLGNTVIVVEHDREMMENADNIFDFGPGPGEHGGQIIAVGTPLEFHTKFDSLTAQYLAGKKSIKLIPQKTVPKSTFVVKISGCRENNLKNVNVEFPLRNMICITGVSGSGKSTLIVDTLYQSLASHFNPFHKSKIGKFTQIYGVEYLKKAILIDQSPIGRTPRSNPATYTGAFNYIRELFAKLPTSQARGFDPGRFSFNVKGGRCESCEGDGVTKIEMQFMPDVYITCDVCRGNRYNSETLEIEFKEKNIAQILTMNVEEAISFFENIPGLLDKLTTLKEVGLSYIHLGQSATTLSGGEAQRVKLATELAKRGTRNTLYLLDEPTTGLHFADIEKLLQVLKALVNLGNTVIVIEHNLDVVKNADWIIDLGPEGGDEGGHIIAQGTPQEIARNPESATGQFLKRILI